MMGWIFQEHLRKKRYFVNAMTNTVDKCNNRMRTQTHSHTLNFKHMHMLGAICGSARSMDRAAQSMDPYFALESMDRAV